MHVPSKTYSSDYNSISDYMRTPLRTDLEPWLIVRKSIISPILSPTLLQIYCIGLIGPISISYFFWVRATICDPTKTIENYFWYHVICQLYCHMSSRKKKKNQIKICTHEISLGKLIGSKIPKYSISSPSLVNIPSLFSHLHS